MCGEKCSNVDTEHQIQGSPPRVRGKAAVCLCRCTNLGITPACAGKRIQQVNRNNERQDHPRVCGEKKLTLDAGKLIPGSPPRVRGKAEIVPVAPPGVGITPACAGKSLQFSGLPGYQWDHPRVCGEKLPVIPCLHLRLGSPPRVRGKD